MRRNLRSIVAAIPALLVMACALGPDYHRPETKVPAAFRFEPTPTTESFADQGWWQVYQDPTLQSLIREALDNNLDVRIAAARIEQARAVLGSTRLQQLPQIAVSADAQRARTSVDQRVGRNRNLRDRKSTRLNSSHEWTSYAVFCLKKKKRRPYVAGHAHTPVRFAAIRK